MLVLIGTAAAPSAAQQPGWQDPLIERLAGDWVLEGTIGGVEVTHDISAEWILDHYYLQLHEWSREMTPDGRHEYEALVLLGWDEDSGQYACLWLDTTGGGGLDVDAQVIGHAKRKGNSIPFVFELDDGGAIHNTFTYREDSATWQWLIRIVRAEESSEFARVTLTRKR